VLADLQTRQDYNVIIQSRSYLNLTWIEIPIAAVDKSYILSARMQDA